VAICDREMRYLAYSRRWIEDYRLPPGEFIGRCHYDVFENIPDKWKQEHQRCFKGEYIDNEEESFKRADGSVDWVRRKVYPWRGSSGRADGLIMFTEVITQRKLAESALRESEEKYRKLAENATDAIFITQDEVIKFPNPKALEILGGRKASTQPVFIAQYIHPEDRDRVLDILRRRLAGEKNLPAEHSFRFIDHRGTEFIMQLNTVQIEWEGRPAVLSFLRDVTEQIKLAESLRQSQKFEAIGTLAGGIAHDFNNLLMGVQGRASLIAADLESSSPHNEHLRAIEDYVRSATNLTKQLLGFARGGKYEVRPIDVNGLVLNSSVMFGRTRKEVKIHTLLSAQPVVIEVDQGQIEQVLLNMYVNAWQAMPDGGDLYLQTQIVTLDESHCRVQRLNPGRYAKISITDTGIGMDNTVCQQIFDPFFTTKSKERGTGLGLASAYGIIKNHGGKIAVSSKPGHGTTFDIYLPLSDQNAAIEHPMMEELVLGSDTVLLVDDEEMIIEVGKALLEKLGYQVIVARSGEHAVEIVKDRSVQIDMVILDLIMPGLNGEKTFDRIREIQPSIPVLLSSGYSINGQAGIILSRGCNGFIQKPFNLSELSQKIRKILDEAKGSI
jgi:two-component system cell cycle sensor histidine kinase/response regulator CckA